MQQLFGSTRYISPQGAKSLPLYKYKGTDHSLIYRYVLNPMNEFLVQFFPMWLAPNTITLAGLFTVSAAHFVMYLYCPDFQGDAPPWVYFLCGITLFIYQTLDSIDGKQARRTGSASPLGLLFDHGCDAFNCTVGSLTMACSIQTGPTWKALAVWACTTIPFYFATWEEFFTGELVMPIVNGPTEGILLTVLGHFACGFLLTRGFWTRETITGVQNNTVFVIFGIVMAIVMVTVNIYNVVSQIKSNKKGQEKTSHSQGKSFRKAFFMLSPFLVFVLLGSLWIIFSPAHVMEKHPRIILWILGLVFCKLVTHLMISHLCDEDYNPFRKTMIPFLFIACSAGFSIIHNVRSVIPESLIVWELFLVALLSYCHLVVGVIGEITAILGNSCFSIKPRVK